MVAPRPEPPTLWIIAGANGSGKSTAYARLAIEEPSGSVWIINPDLLTLRLRQDEGLEPAKANLQAVQRIEAWLYASVETHQTVGVETVLSTPKYRRLVETAKARGFRFKLVYVVLADAELNIERVALRVLKGGHDVARDKIIDRRRRSLEQLPWFLSRADYALVLDNSGEEPLEVAKWTQSAGDVSVEHVETAPREIVEALRAAIELLDD